MPKTYQKPENCTFYLILFFSIGPKLILNHEICAHIVFRFVLAGPNVYLEFAEKPYIYPEMGNLPFW